MSTLSWSARKGDSLQLLDDAQLVTEFTETKEGASATIAGKNWTFHKDKQTASATDGETSFEAHAEKPFKNAKKINASIGRDVAFVNEQKSDWVIEAGEEKLGQFTGANHGVRHVEVELEPDVALDEAQKVFLAWVSRIALEERMVGSTWIITLILLIVSPIALLMFLF